MPKTRKSFHSAAYRRFARKLKDARADAHLTQRQVAKKLGQHPNFAAKIEAGDRRVDFIELQFLARLYKKPLTYFVD